MLAGTALLLALSTQAPSNAELSRILQDLQSEDLELRERAASALVRLGAPAAEALFTRLPGDNPELRGRLVDVLNRIAPLRPLDMFCKKAAAANSISIQMLISSETTSLKTPQEATMLGVSTVKMCAMKGNRFALEVQTKTGKREPGDIKILRSDGQSVRCELENGSTYSWKTPALFSENALRTIVLIGLQPTEYLLPRRGDGEFSEQLLSLFTNGFEPMLKVRNSTTRKEPDALRVLFSVDHHSGATIGSLDAHFSVDAGSGMPLRRISTAVISDTLTLRFQEVFERITLDDRSVTLESFKLNDR